jgi:hypothetical protein
MLNDIKKKEATSMLANKAVVNALLHDLPNLSDENIKTTEYYKQSLINVEKIRDIIVASEDGTFPTEKVKELNALAKEITKSFNN